MHFQWYPGHMTKAKRQMQEDIKLIDVVIELVDARVPLSSKNPDIDELAKNKSRIILLNKYDLASQKYTEEWKKWFESKGYFVALVNSKSGSGVKAVHEVIQKACKEKIERDRKRGILNRPIRAMIVGIPNVGKSTFINSFAGKACAKTGNKPGVTKGKQWIKLNKNVELLDTPGILWPKFEDQTVGLRLAFIGSIKEEILNITELSMEFIKFMHSKYSGMLEKKYEIEKSEDSLETLQRIADRRGCKLKGNELDVNKAAGIILDDYRNGRIGRITLEFPEITETVLEDTKAIDEGKEIDQSK
ncbi:ribosome biogenesis GTPase YlqF [Anaeromicropila herbilytica]|uniref:Ribosome biogenesis GTPase A n=1 Tax=Anaeromicropila herbilytica TaxID=2785025 RepID=A0A7R7EM72_9FIRM|nr:ribosome biogenesis GTPase YlqF [Anaeromicropila herbilytica]BCN31318.1 ribosome biogenesis GTPase A [Anaeromicropila herbilytica]